RVAEQRDGSVAPALQEDAVARRHAEDGVLRSLPDGPQHLGGPAVVHAQDLVLAPGPRAAAGGRHVAGAPPVVAAVADVDQAEAATASPVVADVPGRQPRVLEGDEGQPAQISAVPFLLRARQLAADGGAEAVGA